jgi:hypothetical protein
VERKQWSVVVRKSEEDGPWEIAATGTWNPPEAPRLTGEAIPMVVLNRLTLSYEKNLTSGATFQKYAGDYLYSVSIEEV